MLRSTCSRNDALSINPAALTCMICWCAAILLQGDIDRFCNSKKISQCFSDTCYVSISKLDTMESFNMTILPLTKCRQRICFRQQCFWVHQINVSRLKIGIYIYLYMYLYMYMYLQICIHIYIHIYINTIHPSKFRPPMGLFIYIYAYAYSYI